MGARFTMPRSDDFFHALRPFTSGTYQGVIYSLQALEEAGAVPISQLPISLRIILESVLRHCDGERITEADVRALASWKAGVPVAGEIPFKVARILLQDFTGVPLLVDLAAMRDAVAKLAEDPAFIEPLVPVDLVIDHSIQVDRAGTADAFQANTRLEFERNRERYAFLKWGQQAFETFRVLPSGIGIVHQVNLEYLARGVFEGQLDDGRRLFYPDTLVGTDSHTTMINGLGVVGWGVGGIEAEAGMLGEPVYFPTPEVVGVHLTGALGEDVTATDLTLYITQLLREHRMVGKFVEFYGEGVSRLSLPDRATLANMAPEYGATMGFFPIDERTLEYFRMTGRSEAQVRLIQDYFKAQGLWGIPREGQLAYSQKLDLDLSTLAPSVAGPKRPQDRIAVSHLKETFEDLLCKEVSEGGFGIPVNEVSKCLAVRTHGKAPREGMGETTLGHGSVVIAAITSCTNTSNPSVMMAAGLLAKKAVERGLTIAPTVKTSLAPGSRVVTEYLEATGLQSYLDRLGFHLVGYGCTTCIGNSGPLAPPIGAAIKEGACVVASVLSGNRNFEARIHGAVRANFLMSPPLVVAYALAGRVTIDFDKEPLGTDRDGQPVYLCDLWPTQSEIDAKIDEGITPDQFVQKYANIREASPQWQQIDAPTGERFQWQAESRYIQPPPFFDDFTLAVPSSGEPLLNLLPLAILGDSVTTDHISPAGAIPLNTPAGQYLQASGIAVKDFNSYGSRRGNDRVMTRATFANVRIKNKMVAGREGGWTRLMPEDQVMSIYDACQRYAEREVSLIVFAGWDYGMGSSRDWAAKGTRLLGVKAVIARSFERIHRSNLVGMGVLPLQFKQEDSAESLGLDGTEIFSFPECNPAQLGLKKETLLEIKRRDRSVEQVRLRIRLDTQIEVDYYRNGGILPYVLRRLLNRKAS